MTTKLVLVALLGPVAGAQADCEVPSDAQRMDVTGHWVTPGLIDGHVHVTQNGWMDTRRGMIDVSDEYPWAQVQARNRWQPETYYRPCLCSGTTAVYDVGGFDWTWSLRRPAETDPFAPHVAATGPLISAVDAAQVNATALPGDHQFLQLDSREAAGEIVSYMAANRADGMKLYFPDRIAPEAQEDFHDNVFALVADARQADVPVVAHALMLDQAKLVMRAGASMLVHSVVARPLDDEFIHWPPRTRCFISRPWLSQRVSRDSHALSRAARHP